MAPHLTPKEQDLILIAHAQGKTTPQIHALVEKLRTKKDVPMVNITVLRRFLRTIVAGWKHGAGSGLCLVGMY